MLARARSAARLWLRRLPPLATLFMPDTHAGPAAPIPPVQLYHSSAHQEDPAAALGTPPVLVSADKPSKEQQIEALNAAFQEGLAREREAKDAAWRQRWGKK